MSDHTAGNDHTTHHSDQLHLAGIIGSPEQLHSPIPLVEHDAAWPALFDQEAERIRHALGNRVLLLQHVGSTSIPGIIAKPRIDIVLAVANSAHEADYVPALESRGYVLHVREPHWHQHRMFNGPDTPVNLHVFSVGCSEIERMLLFRDWLSTHESDRLVYERTKRELAARHWTYMQEYADAKTEVVEEIIARARTGQERSSETR